MTRRLLTCLLAATALGALLTSGPAGAVPADLAGPQVFTDATGDVTPRTLDIRTVTVRNTARKLVVRVTFPGVAKRFDYPTGNVSVFLDTDPTRRGAEWGHFTEFWSDYRFAPVTGWREQGAKAGCEAELRSDQGNRLRFFQYTVVKEPGCLTGDRVRVAVSSLNTGDLEPFVEYDEPVSDWLGARRQWTDWVVVPTTR